MAAGNWTPELIDLAGGIDIFGKPGIHSPWITWAELLAQDPDVIIVAPCGFDLARTRGEMHWLTERPDFARLNAVRNRRLFLADGNQFFNRPGPRVVETLRMIEQMIGPKKTASCDGEKWTVYSGRLT
jgi:iron complex transport system substrate-binding protein